MAEAKLKEHGLQPKQFKLLETIEQLRALGIGTTFEFPKFVVCGDQSVGKTTVIQAISRVRLPTNSTRLATELIIRKSEVPQAKVTIEPGSSRTDEEEVRKLQKFEALTHSNDLVPLIQKAKECMGMAEGAEEGFRDDVLKIEIQGPDYYELTLVDLPSLPECIKEDQSSDEPTTARKLVEAYWKHEGNSILVVNSATTNFGAKNALDLAKRFDPSYSRTIGVVTYLNALEPGPEREQTLIRLLKNEPSRTNHRYLPLGWVALPKESAETTNYIHDAYQKGAFEGDQWTEILKSCVGISSLRNRLHTALRFERIVGQALNGMYNDEFFHDSNDKAKTVNLRKLRAVISDLNEDFAEAMELRGSSCIILDPGAQQPIEESQSMSSNPYLRDWEPEYITRAALEAEVAMQIRENRGSSLLVVDLYRNQTKPWKEIAKCHLKTVWDATKHFLHLVLRDLTDECTYPALRSSAIDPALHILKDGLLSKLEELATVASKGCPLLISQRHHSRVLKAWSECQSETLKKKFGPPTATNRGPSAEAFSRAGLQKASWDIDSSDMVIVASAIIDDMKAYYDDAIMMFINNISILSIENCLLEPAKSIFTCLTVNSMDDQQIQDLAMESDLVCLERRRLIDYRDKLRAGLSTLLSNNFFEPHRKDLSKSEASIGAPATKGSAFAQYMARPLKRISIR
ncbi:uncharacterized protein ACLA_032580 [Aspergillus clavatus NRRL 1]|uniref:Uncharacterized protein n=1 Tax=Aspergillus clavatus (strain ATCC 1007 / CBS 513.65 / DSM 816 / NCTC 3887 / NRRL 1 / QM 1276 / 107) TaxID=344612 RepID=A1CSA1_ASPCL|nr:uncharacterized protein ACLA_032580 [Aspergillus clavatus NRRL 1]EAW08522.1 hypothetical protein ACLA_032580 [Aspergillus clavatus NRRL 1]